MPRAPRDAAHFWYAGALGGLDLLHAHYVTHAFKPHVHEGYAIGVVLSGAQALRHDRQRKLLMPQGAVAAINPGEVHTGYAGAASGWRYRMFYPGVELIKTVAADLDPATKAPPALRGPVIHDPDLFVRLLALHRLLEDPAATLLERETRLHQTLALLVRRHGFAPTQDERPAKDDRRVGVIRDYLHEHAHQEIAVADLANLVGLTRSHLTRLFAERTGLPPHSYQVQLRIWRAKSLLRQGEPIAQVATAVGFADQSHLTRHFKRALGVTPGQFQG